jgi:hypothetical protein
MICQVRPFNLLACPGYGDEGDLGINEALENNDAEFKTKKRISFKISCQILSNIQIDN